jgi:hypothetical protein
MEKINLDFGRRYQFPENIKVDYNDFSGNIIINEATAAMAEKYDSFIADQIAAEARKEGIADLTVLNKPAIMLALKKAIPQQVILTPAQCLCPGCHYDMMGLWDNPEASDPAYCPICGQKLKWKEEFIL